LVFLDESSVNTALTRTYGRAPSGERINDYVPDARFERMSVISTIRLGGEMAPFCFEGTLNGELFGAYMDAMLVPILNEGDILIMDNSSVHKVKNVTKSLIDKGIRIMFLPPYSPDFNPIELLWSKVKAFLKKIKERTFDNLADALKRALEHITPTDINNWFFHDGYATEKIQSM
jgi:transposase